MSLLFMLVYVQGSARVRVRSSVRHTGMALLLLHLGFGSNMKATVRLNYSVTVRRG